LRSIGIGTELDPMFPCDRLFDSILFHHGRRVLSTVTAKRTKSTTFLMVVIDQFLRLLRCTTLPGHTCLQAVYASFVLRALSKSPRWSGVQNL
ncbi:MAG: hypothetical protein ACFFC0_01090, partial [Promethearchaeota archaeon]